MVFAICVAIWNVVYCFRMCMLDNKLQTFQPGFISTTLWTRSFVELVYIFAACERLESMFVENVMFISRTVAWPIFTEIWMTSSLEFDAPARCMSTTE